MLKNTYDAYNPSVVSTNQENYKEIQINNSNI
jgi:hypothetical protein